MNDEVAELKAQVAVLREALEKLRNGIETDEPGVHLEIENNTSLAIAMDLADQALAATPSDALKRVRAEVLEEAAEFVELSDLRNADHFAYNIRALKDAP